MSSETLTSGLTGLKDTITNAIGGRPEAAPALAYFHQFGIGLTDATGAAAKASDVLPKLAEAIKGFDPTLQARVLNATGVGEAMLPGMRNGAAGVKSLMDEAQKTGSVMTDQMIANASRLSKAWTRMEMDIVGVNDHLVDSWSETATKSMTATSSWIEKNQDLAVSIEKIGGSVLALAALKPRRPCAATSRPRRCCCRRRE